MRKPGQNPGTELPEWGAHLPQSPQVPTPDTLISQVPGRRPSSLLASSGTGIRKQMEQPPCPTPALVSLPPHPALPRAQEVGAGQGCSTEHGPSETRKQGVGWGARYDSHSRLPSSDLPFLLLLFLGPSSQTPLSPHSFSLFSCLAPPCKVLSEWPPRRIPGCSRSPGNL